MRATLTVVGDTFRWIRSGAGDELTPLRQNETWVRVDRVLPEDAWPASPSSCRRGRTSS